MNGPFEKMPEFTEGIGYGMMFNAADETVNPIVYNHKGKALTLIGTALVTGPDLHQVNVYKHSSGCYYYGTEVHYRPWLGSIDEQMLNADSTPKEMKAITPLLPFYTDLESSSQLCCGFNDMQVDPSSSSVWAVAFKEGEEPLVGDRVQIRKFSDSN